MTHTSHRAPSVLVALVCTLLPVAASADDADDVINEIVRTARGLTAGLFVRRADEFSRGSITHGVQRGKMPLLRRRGILPRFRTAGERYEC